MNKKYGIGKKINKTNIMKYNNLFSLNIHIKIRTPTVSETFKTYETVARVVTKVYYISLTYISYFL